MRRIYFFKLLIVLFSCIGGIETSLSQISTFDIVPDLDGKYVQGQGMIVLPDTHEIFVMGDLIDTTLEQGIQVIRPFLARFDYEGNLINSHLVYDTLFQGKYRISTRPIIRDGSSILVYIDWRENEGNYRASLIAIDIDNGKILKSRVYPQPPGIDSNYTARWYYFDSNKHIVAYHYLINEQRIFIRVLDTMFNVISSFKVDDNGRWNSPGYIEADSDSTFILVGSSRVPSGENYPEMKPFFMIVDHSGKILAFKLASDLMYKTIGFSASNSYTVLKDDAGNWIISAVVVEEQNCSICPHHIPIAFSASPEFDSIRWINYFSGLPFDTRQYYIITSSTLSTDGTGFVVSGYDFALEDRNSFLVKISMAGEKLWTRNFIHKNWEQERISWANAEDVKATPHNTYVLAGTVFDNYTFKRYPWVLQLDSMGCLVPGCDRIVSTDKNIIHQSSSFKVFPNPAVDHLIVFYQGSIEHLSTIAISILSPKGEILKTTQLNLVQGAQYILPIDNLPPGQYIVSMHNAAQSYLQIEKFIKI